MTSKTEALKLTLEALESADWYINQLEMIVYSVDDSETHENRAKVQAAITAIKEALAQPEQEPVAWMSNEDFEPIRVRIMQEAYELADRNDSEGYNAIKVMCGDVQRMLPPKRPWVGLTDDEINDTWKKWVGTDRANKSYTLAIEAKLKEKNFD